MWIETDYIAWSELDFLWANQATNNQIHTPINSHTVTTKTRDLFSEKNRLYCWFVLYIFTYLFNAFKPIITGEIYVTYVTINAFILPSASPNGHRPEIRTPVDIGKAKLAESKSTAAEAAM